jgi:hypothetical protein
MKKTAERRVMNEGRIKKFLEYLMGIHYEDEKSTREQLESQGFSEVTDSFGAPLRMLYTRGKYLIVHTPKTDQITAIYERRYDGRNGNERPPLELLSEVLHDNPSNVGYKPMTGFANAVKIS